MKEFFFRFVERGNVLLTNCFVKYITKLQQIKYYMNGLILIELQNVIGGCDGSG